MKYKIITAAIVMLSIVNVIYAQEKNETVKLPVLTVEQKWETAEGNLIYFVISGISYAKSKGQTAEDFGVWAGKVGCPYWQTLDSLTPAKFVQQISMNKQQFKNFQMEILEAKKSSVKGRMKGFGNNLVTEYNLGGVTEDDYRRFFAKKWETIAGCVKLVYTQKEEGEWTYFNVTKMDGINK
ncbi:MAG: hypothetical protein WCR72_12770 [Bacteroidota bacterium]